MINDTIGIKYYKDYHHPICYIDALENQDSSGDPCFSILLLEKGTCVININNKSTRLIAPAMLCLNETDKYILPDDREHKITAICFHPRLINPVFDFQSIRNGMEQFNIVQQQDIYLLYPFFQRSSQYSGLFIVEENTFAMIKKLAGLIGNELTLQKDCAWPCRSRSYFLELLIIITELYESMKQVSDSYLIEETTKDIDEVLTYLHNNYQSKITLEQLSEMFATNRTSLNERFYKTTNLSVIEYLINLRIHIAETLLRDTRLPISEIMIRVGFNNSTHFWRTFKKYNSLSPKEYRKQYCWL